MGVFKVFVILFQRTNVDEHERYLWKEFVYSSSFFLIHEKASFRLEMSFDFNKLTYDLLATGNKELVTLFMYFVTPIIYQSRSRTDRL